MTSPPQPEERWSVFYEDAEVYMPEENARTFAQDSTEHKVVGEVLIVSPDQSRAELWTRGELVLSGTYDDVMKELRPDVA